MHKEFLNRDFLTRNLNTIRETITSTSTHYWKLLFGFFFSLSFLLWMITIYDSRDSQAPTQVETNNLEYRNCMPIYMHIYVYNQGSRNMVAQSPLATIVGSKIIRALVIIYAVKLTPNAVLWNKYVSDHEL